MTKIYLSTSIPYVNAPPHIGYALEVVQADTLARLYRILDQEIWFQVGTDENAIKNVESAQKLGIPTQELVDKNSQSFQELKDNLNLSYSKFVRTTSRKHIKSSQKFWHLCQKDIYKKKYQGWYCTGCEAFFKDEECKGNVCPVHGRKLELVPEENYFFALSKYQDRLEHLIREDKIKIYPDFRKQEILNFIGKKLEDFSVSRPVERTKGWGIPVPGDETQRIYVWFDALINYITGLGFDEDGELFKKFWLDNNNRYHVIGKDIVKFHAIYWPAMLMSAGIPLPARIYVHGFINVEGRKMSKSLGNVIDPRNLVKKFGTDPVRYYLLREIPPFEDGDYSNSRMQEIYNSELANELGNLVSRITAIAENDHLTADRPENPDYDEDLVKLFDAFQFSKAIETIQNKIKALNKEVDGFAPWKKKPEERKDFLISILKKIYCLGYLLLPVIPETGQKIIDRTHGRIQKTPPLFPKLK
jgi:methionyl-tRNA synthetase